MLESAPLPRSNAASTILKVEGLVKMYGSRRVVDGVSFYVNKGEIVGLLGPNGAGKTTSFRMTCGLINTNGGVVYLDNQNVTDWPMYRRSRDGGMGYLPQDRSVFQKLTVQNNLYGVMEMLGMKRAERKKRCEELLEKFNLTYLRQSYGGSLSGGERRRLEIARSLVSNPKIILLDEPFAAIDPVTVASIQEIIRNLAAEGIAILITDHSVQDTLEITQRSYVIQAGKVLCHGTPDEVTANPEAQKFYFGDKTNRFRDRPDVAVTPQPETLPKALKPVLPSSRFRGGDTKPQAKPDWNDPDWYVSESAIFIQEKERKREPIVGTSRPSPLRFVDPMPPKAEPTEVSASSYDPLEEPSGIRAKRLRPITSSITPDIPPAMDAEIEPDAPPMSSIIRNLGQMIWKK